MHRTILWRALQAHDGHTSRFIFAQPLLLCWLSANFQLVSSCFRNPCSRTMRRTLEQSVANARSQCQDAGLWGWLFLEFCLICRLGKWPIQHPRQLPARASLGMVEPASSSQIPLQILPGSFSSFRCTWPAHPSLRDVNATVSLLPVSPKPQPHLPPRIFSDSSTVNATVRVTAI